MPEPPEFPDPLQGSAIDMNDVHKILRTRVSPEEAHTAVIYKADKFGRVWALHSIIYVHDFVDDVHDHSLINNVSFILHYSINSYTQEASAIVIITPMAQCCN